MPVGIGSELTPNSTFQGQFDNDNDPGALVDIGFIRGAFKVFPLESDFVDDEGNNTFANVGLFSNNQIIFAQDTHKLYQFSEEIEGGIQFEADGFTPVIVNDVPVIIEPSPAKWTEFQFSGSSSTTGDPVDIPSILTLESLTLTRNTNANLLNIFSQSADPTNDGEFISTSIINVGNRGLLTISPKSPTVEPSFPFGEIIHSTYSENHIIASGSAFYLGLPELPNLITGVFDTEGNLPLFTIDNIGLEPEQVGAFVSTSGFGNNLVGTNTINVESGQTFKLSFNVVCTDPNFIHNFKISIYTTDFISGNLYGIENTGINSFTIASTVTGTVFIGFTVTNSAVNYQLLDIKLIQTGL